MACLKPHRERQSRDLNPDVCDSAHVSPPPPLPPAPCCLLTRLPSALRALLRSRGSLTVAGAQGGAREGLGLLKARGRGGSSEAGCMTQTSRAGPWEEGELRACPPPTQHTVMASPWRLQESAENKTPPSPGRAMLASGTFLFKSWLDAPFEREGERPRARGYSPSVTSFPQACTAHLCPLCQSLLEPEF